MWKILNKYVGEWLPCVNKIQAALTCVTFLMGAVMSLQNADLFIMFFYWVLIPQTAALLISNAPVSLCSSTVIRFFWINLPLFFSQLFLLVFTSAFVIRGEMNEGGLIFILPLLGFLPLFFWYYLVMVVASFLMKGLLLSPDPKD